MKFHCDRNGDLLPAYSLCLVCHGTLVLSQVYRVGAHPGANFCSRVCKADFLMRKDDYLDCCEEGEGLVIPASWEPGDAEEEDSQF